MRLNRVPEPALVRSILVALSGVAAYLLGRQLNTDWIEAALTLYGLLTPVIAGAVIRPAVTPVIRTDGES
ncbi:hypothetical protein FOH10_34285 [Nocardia otitidiscaviarum]|uniref:Holin n=1 Tax=Nocardia otitidiscaviarum TaxID=1823 RepID=A0A516NVV4_9NOCA|nr:hypothetical protein [Nocardia otitidiscaviarum]MCP9622535.1 hypothetical protein [Nocardia otitidiscaviarum]QDP83037.1 hypothetical protein FOH10_34285 [Nocardia otitidiscaviarum]